MLRTRTAGSLRAADAGQTVTLAGWVARRRDHGGVIFIDLRDASGVSQVVFREGTVLEQAHRLRSEFCVAVTGVVEIRPEGNANADIATGEVQEASASEASKRASTAGKKGGPARAISLSDEQRSEIARVAANARWKRG